MNFKIKLALVASLMSSSAFAQDLKTTTDSLSYALGVDVANTFKRQNIALDPAVFSRALADVMAGSEKMSMEQGGEFLQRYFMALREKAEQERAKVGLENKAKSDAFLEANKSVEGVVTLPSGLQYQIIKDGNGVKPTTSSTVTVHYTGKTIDGKVFDSSVERGEPVKFGVTQVIRGWTEALQLMPEGAKWKLFIPDGLAYGTNAPPAIGPNQALIFEVELLKVD